MPLTNPNHAVTAQRLQEFHQGILPYLNGPEAEPVVYGMRILRDESVSSAKVEYLEDAIGMIPAAMNFSTGVFNYGSWENAFFMPKPCMLKYDGTVDYYLDPNDYTKKEDGTASDVANTSYGGNAMMEWPKIWLKIVPDATKDNKEADIFISNQKVDNRYTDWNYHNSLGNSVDHFYTSIYALTVVSGKYRSLSGIYPLHGGSVSSTATNGMSYASAVNPSGSSTIWTLETVADVDLINLLLTLIGKSTDTQTVFGKGATNGGGSGWNEGFITGSCNDKGLFFGDNASATIVKVFGMENWWGYMIRRYVGEVMVNGVRKRKLTYGTEDGTTSTGYNLTGEGYIDCGVSAPSGSSGGYISEMIFNQYGIFPLTASGSSTTHYADRLYYSNSGTMIPSHGGSGYQTGNDPLGAFFYKISTGTSPSWDTIDGLSARPLS